LTSSHYVILLDPAEQTTNIPGVNEKLVKLFGSVSRTCILSTIYRVLV